MTNFVKLAHVSDLHLTHIRRFSPPSWNFKSFLGYLNWLRRRRIVHSRSIANKILQDVYNQNVDHVAITGDICNLGLQSEHEEASTWFEIQKLAKLITLVPGNHDIYSHHFDSMSCLRTWKKFMVSDKESAFFLPHIASDFPFVRLLGSIALIGLNSAAPTKPFRADGCLGETQLLELDATLLRLKEEGFLRVLLIHHPPIPGLTTERRALQDAYKLQEILSNRGAELILHGHNHRASIHWLKSREGNPIPIIGVGSGSVSLAGGSEPLASYHLFHLRNIDGRCEISMSIRGLKTKDGDVTELNKYNRLSESVHLEPTQR